MVLSEEFLVLVRTSSTVVKLAGLIANGWSEDGVVMSILHTTRPIHGIQFHPESCGSIQGNQIISQFLTETQTAE